MWRLGCFFVWGLTVEESTSKLTPVVRIKLTPVIRIHRLAPEERKAPASCWLSSGSCPQRLATPQFLLLRLPQHGSLFIKLARRVSRAGLSTTWAAIWLTSHHLCYILLETSHRCSSHSGDIQLMRQGSREAPRPRVSSAWSHHLSASVPQFPTLKLRP